MVDVCVGILWSISYIIGMFVYGYYGRCLCRDIMVDVCVGILWMFLQGYYWNFCVGMI